MTQLFSDDAEWLAHHYDEHGDAFRFVHLPRAKQRGLTFLTDEHIGEGEPFEAVPNSAIDRSSFDQGPIHYVFRSACCCSTLVARMFDDPERSICLRQQRYSADPDGSHRGARASQLRRPLPGRKCV